MSTFRTPSTPCTLGNQAPLALPRRVVHDLIRLSELTGRSFDQELVRVVTFYAEAGMLAPSFGDELNALFVLEHDQDPWEPIGTRLSGAACEAVGETADAYDITPSQALALLTQGTVRTLVRAETRALVRRQRFAEAFLDLIAEDAQAA